MAADRCRSDRGFTLLEVLVAFVIAALALGALFNGATTSLTETAVVGRYEEALSRAESHLATASHGAPSALITQDGEEGHGFRWEVRIAPIASAPPRPPDPLTGDAPAPIALYSIQVTESWNDRAGPRQVRLVGRRIGVAPL
jgi:general secretion pathway protein I